MDSAIHFSNNWGLMFSVAVRLSLAHILSEVQRWSVFKITRYGVIGSRWSSHFCEKVPFLKLFSTIKVSLVAKIMQSAYLCVISSQAQKVTIPRGFNLISNSW